MPLEKNTRPRDCYHRQAYVPWPVPSESSRRQERTPVKPSMATLPKSLFFDGDQSSSWANFRFKFLTYAENQQWDSPTRLRDTFQGICERDRFASFEEVLVKMANGLNLKNHQRQPHEFLSASQGQDEPLVEWA